MFRSRRGIKSLLIMFGVLILSAMMTFIFRIGDAKADGGIFYPIDNPVGETSQRAFIYYQNQTENLVISTSFLGNAKDFAWVVPTPTKPTINKVDINLFSNLSQITRTNQDVIYSKSSIPTFGTISTAEPVEVIEEKSVDVYDTAILKASDENALAEWLADHGYNFPKENSSYLKSYVDESWYFAVAKIQSNLASSGGIDTELKRGALNPLRLTFQSDKIIYPMKLTKFSIDQKVSIYQSTTLPLTLYVLCDHKTSQDLLTTAWANWLSSSKIDKLNQSLKSNDNGGNLIPDKKLFLTKMHQDLEIVNMEDDLIINQADIDTIYPTPAYKTSDFWIGNLGYFIMTILMAIFFPVPLGLFFVFFLLMQYFVKKRWLYVLGLVYETIACLIPPLFMLLAVLAYSDALSEMIFENGFLGAAVALIAFETTAIIFTIKMFRRYKINFKEKNGGEN